MSKQGNRYAAEFRRQMVELVRAGRGSEELAREFEPSGQTIRNWVNQADLDEGRRQDGLTSEVLPPSSVATRLRAVVQVRKRPGCAPY